jgi:hypothetical protein
VLRQVLPGRAGRVIRDSALFTGNAGPKDLVAESAVHENVITDNFFVTVA